MAVRNIFKFEDPTGGGDDAILILPEWAEAPGVLQLFDAAGEPYEFEGAPEDEVEAVESGDEFIVP